MAKRKPSLVFVNWYSVALRHTRHSTHHKHKMAAIVVRGGRILSVAANTNMPHGHAEARAIKRGIDYAGATVIVARGNLLISRPCPKCMAVIEAAGIKKMVYADRLGRLVEETTCQTTF